MSSISHISNTADDVVQAHVREAIERSRGKINPAKDNLSVFCPRYTVRAKYYPVNGQLRLAKVQSFTVPKFSPVPISAVIGSDDRKGKYVSPPVEDGEPLDDDVDPLGAYSDIVRATRRAKISAFDKIACNDDMTLFSTLTFDPGRLDGDTASYEDVYHVLRPWLSNLVSRHGFKYVIAPERHKAGGIHFHMISNAPAALKLDRAVNPHNGRFMSHNRHALYNIGAWSRGFSSSEHIGDERLDRDRVAKYIFKYMGKQMGAKIGGRYLLSGGAFVQPVYIYGDDPDEFLGDDSLVNRYEKEVEVGDGIKYREISFI